MEQWRPIPPDDLFADVDTSARRPTALRESLAHAISTIRWWGWSRTLGVLLCVPLVGFGAFFLLRAPSVPVESSLPYATTTPSTVPQSSSSRPDRSDGTAIEVTVHVAGNVSAPGVYRFASGSRVVDAVRAAGGATSAADLNTINLAGLLEDGSQVYVPATGELPPGGASPTDTKKPTSLPLNLNRASAEELDILPGVGPATATAIVTHRERSGSFTSVEGLLEVPGIGPAKLAALAGLVTV